jgi:hypothetical protein
VSATDAAQLARLKLTYPTWSIGRGVPNGPQFVAVRRATGRRVTASTVAGLEHKLATESPPASDGGVPRARLHSAHGPGAHPHRLCGGQRWAIGDLPPEETGLLTG